MTALLAEVARNLEAGDRLSRGSRLLLAVSGGMDSMVLLHVLHRLSPGREWTLVVAHLDHRLRGRRSEADARWVAAECRRLGVPCVTGRRDVRAFARRRKISIEMAARDLRYAFLCRTARRRGCAVVVTAHHGGDQAELVLLRLLRGSGSDGLGAMRLWSPAPMDGERLLARPLLPVSREQIVAFAASERIPFREDASNRCLDIPRNRIRHELLPLLRRRYQPAVDRVLARTASILAAEGDCLNGLAMEWLGHGSTPFDRLPLALQRRALQLQALQLGISLDFERCEELLRFPDRAVSVPGGVLRRGTDGRLATVPRRDVEHRSTRKTVTLSPRGQVCFAGRTFEWRLEGRRLRGKPRAHPNAEWFDAGRVGGAVCLRHWQPGDRFQPIGMKIPVKLQDLFTNQKVPAAERRRRVVAESESGEIFWVEGLRVGDRFKLTPNTRKRLIWRWKC